MQLVNVTGAMQMLLWPADNWATQAVVMYNTISLVPRPTTFSINGAGLGMRLQ